MSKEISTEQELMEIDIESLLGIRLECLRLACQRNLMGDSKSTIQVAKEYYDFITNEN